MRSVWVDGPSPVECVGLTLTKCPPLEAKALHKAMAIVVRHLAQCCQYVLNMTRNEILHRYHALPLDFDSN